MIDVRSPSEFAQDHIPGAINYPVLSDAERAEVGTVYKQDPFKARKIGAALIARNIASMLEGPLSDETTVPSWPVKVRRPFVPIGVVEPFEPVDSGRN